MARKWWTLLLVCVATFMLLLDITVVNVAPPHAQGQVGDAATAAFVASMNEILLIGAIIALAGAAAGLLLVRERDFVAQPGVEPVAEPAAA